MDINASINHVMEILFSNEKTVHFEKEFAELPAITCIATEINQCLLHILKNAVDAVLQKW